MLNGDCTFNRNLRVFKKFLETKISKFWKLGLKTDLCRNTRNLRNSKRTLLYNVTRSGEWTLLLRAPLATISAQKKKTKIFVPKLYISSNLPKL